MPIEAKSLADDVMRRWPSTIRVFLERRLRCVGCPFGRFHTLEEVSQLHSKDLHALMAALADEIREQGLTNPESGRP
jgi:hybrid cluster-associated redox disulfide protein